MGAAADVTRVEITAPVAGWVHRINAEPGKMVKVGQVLCEIRDTEQPDASADVGSAEATPAAAAISEPATPAPREEELREAPQPEVTEKAADPVQPPSAPPAPSAPARRRRRHPHDDTSPPEAPEAAPEEELDHTLLSSRDSAMDAAGSYRFSGEGGVLPSGPSTAHPPAESSVSQARRARDATDGARRIIKTSPAVRTLAARLGVELGSVRGTGDGGRVTRADVEAAAGGAVGHLSVQGQEGAAPAPSNMTGRLERVAPGVTARQSVQESTRVEFGRTRKVMWRAMGAQAAVPHFG